MSDVAVLISVYEGDNEVFLKDSVKSMLAQTYKALDVHIFMDGILKRPLRKELAYFEDNFSNVFLHSHPSNRGLAVCLNDLISRLWGEYRYYARMDADDVSHSERIQKQVDFLDSHPDVDVVGGSIIDIDERGEELKRVAYPIYHDEILRLFRRRYPMAHVTVMYRQSFFEKAGLYPPVRLEDGLYWMQGMLAGCRFHNLPEYLVYVRRTDDFLRRRSGLRKNWEEFKIKLTINHKLGFGITSYFYATAMFGLQLLPVRVKKILYDNLR